MQNLGHAFQKPQLIALTDLLKAKQNIIAINLGENYLISDNDWDNIFCRSLKDTNISRLYVSVSNEMKKKMQDQIKNNISFSSDEIIQELNISHMWRKQATRKSVKKQKKTKDTEVITIEKITIDIRTRGEFVDFPSPKKICNIHNASFLQNTYYHLSNNNNYNGNYLFHGLRFNDTNCQNYRLIYGLNKSNLDHIISPIKLVTNKNRVKKEKIILGYFSKNGSSCLSLIYPLIYDDEQDGISTSETDLLSLWNSFKPTHLYYTFPEETLLKYENLLIKYLDETYPPYLLKATTNRRGRKHNV